LYVVVWILLGQVAVGTAHMPWARLNRDPNQNLSVQLAVGTAGTAVGTAWLAVGTAVAAVLVLFVYIF